MPNLFPITDFADPALDVYARLTENQLVNREDLSQGLFIAESPKSSAWLWTPVTFLWPCSWSAATSRGRPRIF